MSEGGMTVKEKGLIKHYSKQNNGSGFVYQWSLKQQSGENNYTGLQWLRHTATESGETANWP